MGKLVSIRVITLKQPWAYLFASGFKQNETRSFATSFRGELYIHSSQKIDFNDLELLHDDKHFKKCIPDRSVLIQGAIIGKVNIVDCVPTEKLSNDHYFKDTTKYVNNQEWAFGDYRENRFAWIGKDHKMLDTPIHCRGMLGIWRCEVFEELLKEKEVQHG
jgi:activating signal cointegrator 1